MPSRASWIIGLTVTASLALVGCAATPAPLTTTSGTPSPSPSQSASPTPSTLGSGFYDPDSPPAPEGTITPSPDSFSEAHPPAGYSVVLLSFGTDAQTRTLVRAVKSWATEENVKLDEMVAPSASALIETTYDAIARKPDLIISVGNAMVDPLAAVTPSHLAQNFLIVGAEVAEPTYNVTAADWTGASYRGEGLGTPSKYDPATFTDERAGRALRAGVAAVLNHLTGIVVWVG